MGKPFALTDLSLSSSFQLNQKEFPISKRAPVPGLFFSTKKRAAPTRKTAFLSTALKSSTPQPPNFLACFFFWCVNWKMKEKKGKNFTVVSLECVWNTKECYAALDWSVWGWGNTTCTKKLHNNIVKQTTYLSLRTWIQFSKKSNKNICSSRTQQFSRSRIRKMEKSKGLIFSREIVM